MEQQHNGIASNALVLALKLWNMTIEMILLINTKNTQKLSIVATCKYGGMIYYKSFLL